MSHCAVSDLHIVPQKQTVIAAYYRNNILEKTCLDAIERKRKTGNITERAMLKTCQIIYLCSTVHQHIRPMQHNHGVQTISHGFGKKVSGLATLQT